MSLYIYNWFPPFVHSGSFLEESWRARRLGQAWERLGPQDVVSLERHPGLCGLFECAGGCASTALEGAAVAPEADQRAEGQQGQAAARDRALASLHWRSLMQTLLLGRGSGTSVDLMPFCWGGAIIPLDYSDWIQDCRVWAACDVRISNGNILSLLWLLMHRSV